MDEAKHLVNMFVAVVISGAVLVAAAGLIFLSQTFTRHFDKQEQQSIRMQEYAEYSSYDNKNVRGQEIISLIESHKDDIFILIYNNSNPSIGVNKNEDGYRKLTDLGGQSKEDYYKGLTTSNTLLAYCGSVTTFANYASAPVKPNSSNLNVPSGTINSTQGTQLDNLTTWSKMANREVNYSMNLYDMSSDQLIQAFTSKSYLNESGTLVKPNLCGFVQSSPQEEVTDSADNLITNPQYEGTYAPFHGNLIYADEASSEVIGIIFTRLPTIEEVL